MRLNQSINQSMKFNLFLQPRKIEGYESSSISNKFIYNLSVCLYVSSFFLSSLFFFPFLIIKIYYSALYIVNNFSSFSLSPIVKTKKKKEKRKNNKNKNGQLRITRRKFRSALGFAISHPKLGLRPLRHPPSRDIFIRRHRDMDFFISSFLKKKINKKK